MLTNIWRVHVRRLGPSSFQWCPVTGQGAMGTNWSTGSSFWTWGRTSSLWGWRSTGTGCPGRLWSLLLWTYSRPAWTQSSTTYCRWPCFGRRVGLDDPQSSLPTPTMLWFWDSVNTQKMTIAGTVWWTLQRASSVLNILRTDVLNTRTLLRTPGFSELYCCSIVLHDITWRQLLGATDSLWVHPPFCSRWW